VVHFVGPGRVRLDNERLAFEAGWEGQAPARQVFVDVEALEHLCCYGRVQISVEAMHLLLSRQVNVALLSSNGREFFGRLASEHGQKPLDRVVQAAVLSNPENRFELAKALVEDKVRSQIGAARHFQRHGHGCAGEALDRLKAILEQVQAARGVESMRGLEGLASSAWFDLFARLVRKPFHFPKRVRRPPTDPVNALLSLGYTLLTERTTARLTALGYEPAIGCLHEFRSGRPSLACDHVEPLRVHAVDRWVLALLNERKVAPDDFETPSAATGVRLVKGAFPRVLASWEVHWRESRSSDILDRQIFAFRNRLREFRPKLPTLLRQLDGGCGWAGE
jgi:CRISPR-associated protein Cas1